MAFLALTPNRGTNMASWEELKEDVENNGNVLTLTMESLRDAYGASKLGVHVCAGIRKTLAGIGLGHVPQELPLYQHEQVRLYKKGTDVGDLIDTVLIPGPQNDQSLAERFTNAEGQDYVAIVQAIRELVSE